MASRRPIVREVMSIAEFRALWLAHAQSRLGDQIGRVAISILVFERTSSAALTALVYATSLLPPLISAPLLTGLADRFPRRTLMVVTEVCRAALMAVMAIPGLPLVVTAGLLAIVVSAQPLYSACRNSILPSVLAGERYVVGVGLTSATDSLVQIVGFAGGGLLIGLTGPNAALGLNALTFLISAGLVQSRVGIHRPDIAMPRSLSRSLAEGVRLIWGDRRLRCLLGLLYLYGLYVAPEGLAASFAAGEHAGRHAIGILMAADPIGAMIGSWLVIRVIPAEWRHRMLMPLAAASGIPLVMSALFPSVLGAVILWTLVGVVSSYTLIVHTMFVRMVPDGQRGQVIGLASAGLQGAQGLGILFAGILADLTTPATAVGIVGAVGTLLAIVIGLVGRGLLSART
ncbi:MFS transporter [Streptomyces sp. SID13031]|uniref:MFS transporter n=1 Tax=Streptomyces sp. SID13031 TaxID=2706046 RepID=UPI0013CC2895|nr:MFS transporter [Streptomyces sp. SID13031]NEA31290.1 MFS transporter [Streptomyces sp. SID13031]